MALDTPRVRSRLDILYLVTREFHAALNIDQALYNVLSATVASVGAADAGLFLFDADGNLENSLVVSKFEIQRQGEAALKALTEQGLAGWVKEHQKGVLIQDTATDERWYTGSAAPELLGAGSAVGVPIQLADRLIGVLMITAAKTNHFDESDLAMLTIIADHAATTVANAQIVAQLKNTEASYANLFEDNADMLLITNYEGLILAANRKACQILRRHKDAVIKSDIGFIDPGLAKYLAQQMRRLKRWREATIELEIKDAYRQLVPLEFRIRQIQFGGKDCVEWVGRDISMRREIEQMREDLVHMLVHDLRGPLSNMTNTIDLISALISRTDSPPQINPLLDIAKRSSQALKDLVDAILDVSRLEQGELPLQRTMTPLDLLLRTVQEQVTPQAQAKNMSLNIDPVAGTPEAWLDSNLIRRVLVNLVGNAIKYTPASGWVALKTTLSDKKLHFIISDNGLGISPAYQARIFDKFARVDHSANTPSGVGLGLAFCKLAIEAHGGTISVESKGLPGEGSTFHVTLPLISEKPGE